MRELDPSNTSLKLSFLQSNLLIFSFQLSTVHQSTLFIRASHPSAISIHYDPVAFRFATKPPHITNLTSLAFSIRSETSTFVGEYKLCEWKKR